MLAAIAHLGTFLCAAANPWATSLIAYAKALKGSPSLRRYSTTQLEMLGAVSAMSHPTRHHSTRLRISRDTSK
ncbi:hypothetical protein P389DRAFT_56687 [Cystobasidium minutum MCA 4210]|uniref:uncharacterized protein n=1 Tax=Cystobasidium minutum MCA 4210 TaxID=1397322 RepID=UPI0034CDBA02|eukprot:jgi/Rhomi1/56687/CE56686_14